MARQEPRPTKPGIFKQPLRQGLIERLAGNLALAALILAGFSGAVASGAPTASGDPVPLLRAHSHNDYQQPRPLLDALEQGFCSFEADVHLIGGQLLVGHSRLQTSPQRTLQRLYLDPLRNRARQNGGRIYREGPVCWLFVDLKTEAEATYAALHRVLAGYGDLVTRFESGRVTTNALLVIITGNRPRQTIAAQSLRYAACDGLAADLVSDVSPLLVPVVSEQWSKFFAWRGRSVISSNDLARLGEFVGQAHTRGRKLRWWDAPDNPAAWQVLFDAGVDLLNTDHPAGLGQFLLSRTQATDAIRPSGNPYSRWRQGPPSGPDFFPIAVWLQSPQKAARYRAAGFNTYVGLWKGPTEEQFATLKTAGMKVICEQNEVGLRHRDDPAIIGWMHGDEPDNAQSLGSGRGYGPPIPPEDIVRDYQRIRQADPSRPVLLNLGQGVAWDRWHGRGTRTNHPEDYPEYAKGGDIISFDIYPAAHSHPEVAGNLWFVAQGVERLVQWTAGQKVVWDCLECTRIQNAARKATPQQVRAEAWMSLIHGSMGLIYFVHEWQPKFNESALLSDPEMLEAVTALNGQIQRLAPVLNTPTLQEAVQVIPGDTNAPVAVMAKRHQNALYVFAVAMRGAGGTATVGLRGRSGVATVEVLDEDRRLEARDGVFSDRFEGWQVHLYRLASP